MRFIELFAGIGGFRLGLEKAFCNKNRGTLSRKKWEYKQNNVYTKGKHQAICVYANEWDYDPYKKEKQYAWKIYQKQFGTKELDTRNIEDVPVESIPNHNLLTAGFPCQRFSIAGKRKGMSGEDTKGSEFYEIYRIAKYRQPQLLLLENVPGLFSSRGGEDFYTILKSLDEIGYDVEWDCINTSVFLPQNRLRVFIVGHLRGKGGQKVFPIGEDDDVYKRQDKKRVDNTHSRTLRSSYYKIHTDETLIAEESVCAIKSVQWDMSGKGYKSQQDRAYRTDGIMCCLPNANPDNKLNIISPTLHGFKHGTHKHFNEILPNQLRLIRRLTPTECERLQGFPDGWTEGISDTQRYKCLGNAVTVNVIEEIGKRIAKVQQRIF